MKQKRIIIADDDRALKMLISGILKIGDFEVIEANDGVEVVKILDREKPDLVILDVMMPGLNGYEVCKYIKSNPYLKEIKVIMLTAKTQQPENKKSEDFRADCYMSKPFTPAGLLDAVEKMLAV